MSTLRTEVTYIRDIRPHPNADTIELATVNGWQVVVRKGQFAAGDPVVYFERGAQIPRDLAEQLGYGVTKYRPPMREMEETLAHKYSMTLLAQLTGWRVVATRIALVLCSIANVLIALGYTLSAPLFITCIGIIASLVVDSAIMLLVHAGFVERRGRAAARRDIDTVKRMTDDQYVAWIEGDDPYEDGPMGPHRRHDGRVLPPGIVGQARWRRMGLSWLTTYDYMQRGVDVLVD